MALVFSIISVVGDFVELWFLICLCGCKKVVEENSRNGSLNCSFVAFEVGAQNYLFQFLM